jgi:hypothetical protein
MGAPEEIEALVAHEGRTPGTDAERRAAHHLKGRLEELGREAETEHVDAWPAWHLNYALLALIAVVVIVALLALGPKIFSTFDYVSSQL